MTLTRCVPSTVTAPPTLKRVTKIAGHAIGNVASRESTWT